MILFKDMLNGAELFSDSYKLKLVDDVLYEVEGKLVTETSEFNESLIGANASADGCEEDEGATATSVSGCNVVLANRLMEFCFKDKKEFQQYIKKYIGLVMKRVEEKDSSRLPTFKAGAQKVVKKILDDYKNWQFFAGEDKADTVFDPDGTVGGMVALMNFREDGITPYMLFWKDGLEEEKV